MFGGDKFNKEENLIFSVLGTYLVHLLIPLIGYISFRVNLKYIQYVVRKFGNK